MSNQEDIKPNKLFIKIAPKETVYSSGFFNLIESLFIEAHNNLRQLLNDSGELTENQIDEGFRVVLDFQLALLRAKNEKTPETKEKVQLALRDFNNFFGSLSNAILVRN